VGFYCILVGVLKHHLVGGRRAMPDEPEVDADELRETAAEEMETHGERFR
jgi:hypothetical protein